MLGLVLGKLLRKGKLTKCNAFLGEINQLMSQQHTLLKLPMHKRMKACLCASLLKFVTWTGFYF